MLAVFLVMLSITMDERWKDRILAASPTPLLQLPTPDGPPGALLFFLQQTVSLSCQSCVSPQPLCARVPSRVVFHRRLLRHYFCAHSEASCFGLSRGGSLLMLDAFLRCFVILCLQFF